MCVCVQLVLSIEGEQLVQEGLWPTLHQLASRAVRLFGEGPLEDWVTGARTLLLVSNWPCPALTAHRTLQDSTVQDQVEASNETLQYYLSDLPNAHFIFVTRNQYVENVVKFIRDEIKVYVTHMKMIAHFKTLIQTMNVEKKKIFQWVDGNIWKNDLIKYPMSRSYFQNALKKYPSVVSCESKGQFLWKIVQYQLLHFQKRYQIKPEIVSDMLMTVSTIAYKALCNTSTNVQYASTPSYNDSLMKKFLEYLVIVQDSILPCSYKLYHFPHVSIQQMLAAWFLYKNQKPLLASASCTRCGDAVAALFGSHLYRELSVQNEKTVRWNLKNLYLWSENSQTPNNYILHLLSELCCSSSLMEILFRNTVFQRELHLYESSLLSKPLACYLKLTEPRKILITVRPGINYLNIVDTIKYCLDIDTYIGFALMNHIEWNNSELSDDILLTVLSHNSKLRLHDFIGCLSTKAIKLLNPHSTPYLTCIRLRVTSEEAVTEALQVQKYLPKLLWYELDFDIEPMTLFRMQLPVITSPMCDLSFRDVDNEHVFHLVNFLSMVRVNYLSGLHIHRSRLTVDSIVDILIELKVRQLKLSTPKEIVMVYRSWKYLEMAVLTKSEIENDDKVQHLLGFDDRSQYSDNEIRSSTYTNGKSVKRLIAILEQDTGIYFFQCCYTNVLISKTTNGKVKLIELIPNAIEMLEETP